MRTFAALFLPPLLLAAAAAALRPGEVSMGTTILAVRFEGGECVFCQYSRDVHNICNLLSAHNICYLHHIPQASSWEPTPAPASAAT